MIVDFHRDSEDHWVADLACGHKVHTRHNPPAESRPWVLDVSKRQEKIGSLMNCKRCEEVGLVVSEAVLKSCKDTIKMAWEEGGNAGMCESGRLDLLVDYLETLNLKKISQEAIANKTTELGTLT